jgi:hypothetical protein
MRVCMRVYACVSLRLRCASVSCYHIEQIKQAMLPLQLRVKHVIDRGFLARKYQTEHFNLRGLK